MSKYQNPRIALTVPKELNEILSELAAYQDIPKTKFITDLLIEMKPTFEQMLFAFREIEKDRDNALNIVKSFGVNAVADAAKKTSDLAFEVSSYDD